MTLIYCFWMAQTWHQCGAGVSEPGGRTLETLPDPCLSWQERPKLGSLLFSQHRLVNMDRSFPSSPGPGGTHCLGASVEHAVCENPPCPKGLPSFRDQQCQTHDRLSSKKGLLTAVVVDGKGIWRIPSQWPLSLLFQEHKHLLGKPRGHTPPCNPLNGMLWSSCPSQPWTHFLSSGVELG